VLTQSDLGKLLGCLLGLSDPSELLGVLLELHPVDPQGLLLGQVLATLEELSHEAHPASIGLVEAHVVVVASLHRGLLIRGLLLVESQDGTLHPLRVRQELDLDGLNQGLESNRLSALGLHGVSCSVPVQDNKSPSEHGKGLLAFGARARCRFPR